MKEKIKSNLVIDIEKNIDQIIKANNLILVDIDIFGGKNRQISVIVYSNENLGIDELTSISRIIKPVLEKIPSLKEDFNLEVSSPGIYRNLKFLKEFDIFKGRKIKIVTEEGLVLTGTCNGTDEKTLSFTDEKNETIKIVFDNIKRANLNG